MIGFFGDSWIDTYGDKTHSWPAIAKNLSGMDADFYGKSGTSHWYAYDTFLKKYKKYDVIVFSHTTYTRWPSLPASEGLRHWDTGHMKSIDTSPVMKFLNLNYMELWPDELLTFLCENIYKDINKRCREENKYLINVFPYKNPYDTSTDFPKLINLDSVSNAEKTIDGTNITNWVSKKNISDIRFCHFNFKNNKKIGNMITDLIINRDKNIEIDFTKHEWDVFDEDLDKIIEDHK